MGNSKTTEIKQLKSPAAPNYVLLLFLSIVLLVLLNSIFLLLLSLSLHLFLPSANLPPTPQICQFTRAPSPDLSNLQLPPVRIFFLLHQLSSCSLWFRYIPHGCTLGSFADFMNSVNIMTESRRQKDHGQSGGSGRSDLGEEASTNSIAKTPRVPQHHCKPPSRAVPGKYLDK